MGNVHAHRRRLTPALILVATVALLIMLAMAVSASIGAQNAQALPTFTDPVSGVGPCSSCHSYSMGDAFHTKSTHSAQSCGKCHTVNTATPPLPSACASCHGGSAATIIAGQALHVSAGCGTVGGCHTAPVQVTTTMTAKVAPTTVTVGKKVKVTGTAGPATSLAGAKVAWKVERKVGTKWVKMKTGSATASATGAFTWSYKAVKKGAHRVTLTIAATSTYTKKSLVKPFKVK
jgi:predicted secreted protein